MYKKSSSFVNGRRPLYGWSTQSTKPNSYPADICVLGSNLTKKIKDSKEKGLYWMSDEEREKLIQEFLEKRDAILHKETDSD